MPLSTCVTAPDRTASARPAGDGRAARVLLAEDNEPVRRLFVDLLEAEGYEVVIAEDGREAEELWWAQRHHIDAVVLDHQMPRRTGLDVARALRREAPGVPVLMVSAQLSDTLRDEAGTLGVPAFHKHEAQAMLDALAVELLTSSSS